MCPLINLYFIDNFNMKAIIANGPKDYKLIYDKPIPKIQDGQVLVKVLATGICKIYLFLLDKVFF